MQLVKIFVFSYLLLDLIACSGSRSAISLIPEEEYEYIENQYPRHNAMLRSCFKEYMDASSFLDETGFVSSRSVERFKTIFLDNAKVWNDYLWEPKMEYAVDYADQVYYLHRVRGLKVSYEENILSRLSEMKIDEVFVSSKTNDAGGKVYKYKFKARKDVFYILNKEQKVIYYDEPRSHDLEFIFIVDKSTQEAKILDILPFTIEDK